MQSTSNRDIRSHGTNIIRETSAESSALTLTRNDERLELRSGNTLVGHVTDGTLYGLDRQGYAVPIDSPADDREAVQMLREWWNNVR